MSDIADIPVEEFIGLTIDEVIPDEETRDEIITFLDSEIDDVINDRSENETQWETWRRHRMSRPESASKNYPWEGSSNICTPMTMQSTNTIFANVKGKFSSKKPFLMVSCNKEELKDSAQALERFMNVLFESKHHINIRRVNLTLLYELVSMGTEFVKVPWTVDKWQFKRDGSVVDKVVYMGPEVIPVPIDDVFCKQHWHNLQKAPWYAVRTRYSEHSIRQLVNNGIFDSEAVELILSGPETDVPTINESILDITGGSSQVDSESPTMEFDIYEVSIFWDVDDDGVPEDLKLWFHKETGTIIRAEFNELGVRDLIRIPYMNVPYNLYGAGVGWMLEQTQEEVDTLHNIRINSLHISSLQMFVTKQGSKLGKIKFKPLMNLQVENPREDFIPIKFPDVSSNTLQAEELAKQEGRNAVGASDAMSGQPNMVAKSRVTASGEMLQVQRGSLIQESYIQNIEEGYAEIGMLVLYQLIYNSELTKNYLLPLMSPEDQELIRPILDMNVEDIPQIFYFDVQTTEMDLTEDAKRQKAMALQQMYDQYTQTILNYGMMLPQVPPNLQPTIMKFIVGQTEMMEKNLELFGEMRPEDFVLYVDDMKAMVGAFELQQRAQAEQLSARVGGNNGISSSPPGGMGGPVNPPGVAGAMGQTEGEVGGQVL